MGKVNVDKSTLQFMLKVAANSKKTLKYYYYYYFFVSF